MNAEKQIAPLHILVVEDDYDDQYLIKQILEKQLIKTAYHFTENGEAALDYIEQGAKIDIILLDLNMPVMDGFEFLSVLKQRFSVRQFPVIVFSTSSNIDDKEKALKLGANDYIIKPSNIDQIDETFSSALISNIDRAITINKPTLQAVSRNSILDINILHIDDDEVDHYLLQGVLNHNKKLQCNLSFSTSLKKAKQILSTQMIDIIILDLNLGEANGINVLQECAQLACHTPIIVLTGESEYIDEESFIRSGASDFINKSELNTTLLCKSIMFSLERQKLQNKLEQLATYDSLTTLHNRSSFYRNLDLYIEHAKRNDTRLALAFLDMDKFKPINDQYGHIVGDAILNMFAIRLKKHLRKTDFAARYGGDEFAIILSNYHNFDDALTALHNKQLELIKPYPVIIDEKEVNIEIGLTIGVSEWNREIASRDLIMKADKLMYQGKNEKPNTIVY